jgi:hypothetical protein
MTAQGKTDVRIRYRQLARQLVYQALTTSNPPLPGAADVQFTSCAPSGPLPAARDASRPVP